MQVPGLSEIIGTQIELLIWVLWFPFPWAGYDVITSYGKAGHTYYRNVTFSCGSYKKTTFFRKEIRCASKRLILYVY